MDVAKDSSILTAILNSNLVIMNAQDGSILGTCNHGLGTIRSVAISDNGKRVSFMHLVNISDFFLGVADTESMTINVF